ncbi:MAG: radical SAM protein [Lachnospiraceae bacterium]|nr:radical SAM protein [Lachnospiraceae bacterium]
MIQIISPDKKVTSILGFQKKTKDEPVRLLSFCIVNDVPDGRLLYNNLTKELVFLSPEESAQMYASEDLFARWFLVPNKFDDKRILSELTSLGKSIQQYQSQQKTYTILPTTACNARCFYCFERNLKPTSMTQETAQATITFIKNSTPSKRARIRWFGGEPLFAMDNIDFICESLKNEITFSSSMTTNGYLLSPQILPKAKALWNLKNVQITLDGTREIYNRTKNYIYSDGDAFQTVLNNINHAAAEGIRVSLRLNIGQHNKEDLYNLIEELSGCLEPKENIHLYVIPLFEKEGFVPINRSTSERTDLYNHADDLESLAIRHGFQPSPKGSLSSFRFYRCLADNPSSIVINADGSLLRCEHIHSNASVGTVFDGNNSTSLGVWKKYYPLTPLCENCPLLPSCQRPEGCIEAESCFIEIKKHRIKILEDQILSKYKRFKEKNS